MVYWFIHTLVPQGIPGTILGPVRTQDGRFRFPIPGSTHGAGPEDVKGAIEKYEESLEAHDCQALQDIPR